MTAAYLQASGRHDVELAIVTPELHPLQLFGETASDAVRDAARRGRRGVRRRLLRRRSRRREVSCSSPARLSRWIASSRSRDSAGSGSTAFPRRSRASSTSTSTAASRGTDAVFAAGDITSFPVKQGGIAAQQAVAAAEAIAVLAGASLVPHPFRPVLRGLLLTGAEPQYLRRDLSGGERAGLGQRLADLVAADEDRRPATRSVSRSADGRDARLRPRAAGGRGAGGRAARPSRARARPLEPRRAAGLARGGGEVGRHGDALVPAARRARDDARRGGARNARARRRLRARRRR